LTYNDLTNSSVIKKLFIVNATELGSPIGRLFYHSVDIGLKFDWIFHKILEPP